MGQKSSVLSRRYDYRSIGALAFSIALHLTIFCLLFLSFQYAVYIPPKQGDKSGDRFSLKDFRFSTAKPTPSGIQQQPPTTPPVPQNLPQKLEQKPLAKPQEQQKQQELSKPKPKQENPKKQEITKTTQKQTTSAKTPTLEQSIPQSPSISKSPSLYDLSFEPKNEEINRLYGEEIFSLNKEQVKFLQDNLRSIGRITQSYLRYPTIAAKTQQKGENLVEFFLYPNGNISEVKILNSSGYSLLDRNTIKTIELAYRDYPLPSQKTKIRILVSYTINGY